MKVKCNYLKINNVNEKSASYLINSNAEDDYFLTVGDEYTVYGITIRDNYPWYYLCDRSHTDYPQWKPPFFFKVVDPRLSRYWIYSFNKLEDYVDFEPIFTFPEWANNHPNFYDKLSDGDDAEAEIFQYYKELMDLEFPHSLIKDNAQIVDNEWLLCSSCIDAWQNKNEEDALVRCPKCKKLLNNPRYQNRK